MDNHRGGGRTIKYSLIYKITSGCSNSSNCTRKINMASGISATLLPQFTVKQQNSPCYSTPNFAAEQQQCVPSIWSKVLPLAVAVSLVAPLSSSAIPSLNSKSTPVAPMTPFSQSKNLPTGLENGKIRPCPSVNPGCVSTNPQSSSSAFPLIISQNSSGNAIMVKKMRTF